MKKVAWGLLALFLSVVGYAAAAAPPASGDCRMLMWFANGNLEFGCWSGPCDLPGSVCTTTEQEILGLLHRWCYCSGFESTGVPCPGTIVYSERWEEWTQHCEFGYPCLEVGVCRRNEPAGSVPQPICTCLFPGPVL